MIFKIQKPLFTSVGESFYLVYNKNRNTVINDIAVGEFSGLDKMFEKNEYKIFIEGYVDKKDRLVVKRKIENQNW